MSSYLNEIVTQNCTILGKQIQTLNSDLLGKNRHLVCGFSGISYNETTVKIKHLNASAANTPEFSCLF